MASKKIIKVSTPLFVFALGLCTASRGYCADAKLINLVGRVQINGKIAKIGDVIPKGAKVIAEQGSAATIAVGNDDVLKVSSESVLQFESTGNDNKNVKVLLEKGRVEGVKKLEGLSTSMPSAVTQIETPTGTMEVAGGRYLISESPSKDGSAVFLSVDGAAKVTSNSRSLLSSNLGNAVSLGRGEAVTVKAEPSQADSKVNTIAIVKKEVLPPSEVKRIMPPVPSMKSPQRDVASVPQRQPSLVPPAPGFRDLQPREPSPVNQDPLRPVIGRPAANSKVDVIFNY